ncbi:complex I subunit 4 family protein [Halocalculus aciditolerans]|uniref:Oxidoreductase n=1 Tax=Halocalculus aciditolerans TaxID=1383812 RepID=A0A830F787_9EURY|nr:NADH-quinone oxidoreductase subunit M [Halocalculus aciditolerans]GGL61343.1 oxidoreductase [Halocalculus aciditolerans]
MLLELLLAVTLVGAAAVLLAPESWAERLAYYASLLPLLGSLALYASFDATGNALTGRPAFETQIPWFEFGGVAASFHLGLDGLSLPLVILTTLLTTVAIFASRPYVAEKKRVYYALLLFTEFSLIGVFSALDFLLWFVFWEFVLAPLYLLVSMYGGPRRTYAAIKFFVYTNVASLVLFLGVSALVYASGTPSFDLGAIAAAAGTGMGTYYGVPVAQLAFALLFFGFAVKSAFVPVHTWLPDVYVEAPTPVTVVLAGVVTKMGTYSLVRFNYTMLPEVAQQWAPYIAGVATLTVLYGAFVALSQQDAKRLVAYTSIPSMGFLLLGLAAGTPYGLAGAGFQMVSHGLLIAVLFLGVGILERVTGTRTIDKLSGLADRLPVTAAVVVAGAFGYMGLPLLSGFAAEFLVFTGSFAATYPGAQVITAVAMFGIVVVAGYLLYFLQRVLFGPFAHDVDGDLGTPSFYEVAPAVVLVVLAVALGTAPDLVLGAIQSAVHPLAAALGGGL